jgi:hypothetical protein
MHQPKVNDWTTDYDILDPEYVVHPYAVWDDLREGCPVAHSDRWGGSWMPTRYADVFAAAHDVVDRHGVEAVGEDGEARDLNGQVDLVPQEIGCRERDQEDQR